MATKNGRQSKESTIAHLVKVTKLQREDVVNLMDRFKELCKLEDGKLHRMEFRDELNTSFNITDDILMDRVFRAFDRRSYGNLRLEDYVIGIAKYLVGNVDEVVELCFKVYDLNNDGYIGREEMFQLLKKSLVKASAEEDPDELVKDLVELVMKRLDVDHDGRVSLEDFRIAIHEEKLLMEALGKCLPDAKCKKVYEETIRNCSAARNRTQGTVTISEQRGNDTKKRAQRTANRIK